MKRLPQLIALGLILLLAACGKNLSEVPHYIATKGGAKLYIAPDRDSKLVTRLAEGTEVFIQHEMEAPSTMGTTDQHWVQVKSGELEGWLLSGELTITPPASPPAPDSASRMPSGQTAPQDSSGQQGTTTQNDTTEEQDTPPAEDAPPGEEDPQDAVDISEASNIPSLIADARQRLYTLPTYANDLDDMVVGLSKLQPWNASAADYAGTYLASLESPTLLEVQVRAVQGGKVNIVFSYTKEEVTQEGLIEDIEGEQPLYQLSPQQGYVQWVGVRTTIDPDEAQFVTWQDGSKTHYGLLTRSSNTGQSNFLLFRRFK